jgi:hypothetical protein
MLLERIFLRGRRQLALVASASSDDQGRYRLAGLAPGRYYLAAERRTFGFTDARETFALTYFPSALDPSGAVPVDVTSGNEAGGFDLRLETTRVYNLRGIAVDAASGAPPTAATLTAISIDSSSSPLGFVSQRAAQTVRPGGRFEIRNLPTGTYVLRGTGQRESGGALVARAEISLGGDVDNAIIDFGPGVALDGIVRFTGGDAKSTAPLQLGVNFAEAEGVTVNAPVALVQEDGAFTLRGLAPARYFLTVTGLPDDIYVKSIRLGNLDLTHTSMDLTRVSEGLAEITLSTGAGSVGGVILNDRNEPLGGVAVSLWPKAPETGSANLGVRAATTDQTGAFRFAGLPPGDYYAAAWEEPEPGLTSSYDFVSRFATDAAELKLEESHALAVPLRRIAREKVAEEAAKLP